MGDAMLHSFTSELFPLGIQSFIIRLWTCSRCTSVHVSGGTLGGSPAISLGGGKSSAAPQSPLQTRVGCLLQSCFARCSSSCCRAKPVQTMNSVNGGLSDMPGTYIPWTLELKQLGLLSEITLKCLYAVNAVALLTRLPEHICTNGRVS